MQVKIRVIGGGGGGGTSKRFAEKTFRELAPQALVLNVILLIKAIFI